MILAVPTVPAPMELEAWPRHEADPLWRSFDRAAGVRTCQFDRIVVGEAVYPLRRPVTGEYFPGRAATGTPGKFRVEEFGAAFIGTGDSPTSARADWFHRVHAAFQQLYGKRPFEMSPDEVAQWRLLSSRIDVELYANTAPVTMRELGQAIDMRPGHQTIRWIHGRPEQVAFEQFPAEFAGYRPGQWFEAFVDRDPATWKLIRARHVQRMPALDSRSDADIRRLFDSWPGTDSLPEADWD